MKYRASPVALSFCFIFAGVLGVGALPACRQVKEQPEGLTPSGKKLDPDFPKDVRLVELFEAAKTLDETKTKSYKSCTDKTYLADLNTKTLPEVPNFEFVSNYTYDALGNKTKEVRTYFKTTNTTEWKYDSLGRVESSVSSSSDDSSQEPVVSGNCKATYDGTSLRITKYECFDGDGSAEEDLSSRVDVTYELPLNKRTITENELIDDVFRVVRKTTEEHADQKFGFVLKSEVLDYDYDEDVQKVSAKTTLETIFEENKFSYFTYTNEEYLNNKLSLKKILCRFENSLLNCTVENKNADGEVFETGKSQMFPVIIKRRQIDLFDNFEDARLDPVQLGFLTTSSSTAGVEGKRDAEDKIPYTLFERTAVYDSLLRQTSSNIYSIKEGKHSEKIYSDSYEDGQEISEVRSRLNSGQAITREALGEFVVDSKTVKTCAM